jgi:hypothetical protein
VVPFAAAESPPATYPVWDALTYVLDMPTLPLETSVPRPLPIQVPLLVDMLRGAAAVVTKWSVGVSHEEWCAGHDGTSPLGSLPSPMTTREEEQ